MKFTYQIVHENKKKSLILGQQPNSKKAVKMGRREYLIVSESTELAMFFSVMSDSRLSANAFTVPPIPLNLVMKMIIILYIF